MDDATRPLLASSPCPYSTQLRKHLVGGRRRRKSVAGSANQLQLVINMISAGLGSGIFALPWSTAGASVIPAVSIIGLVLFLNAWTISIVVEAGERYQIFDLGSLLGKLPGRLGRGAQVVCNVILWISTYLCLVSFLLVITDCISVCVDLGAHSREKTVVLSCALILPLCHLDQKRLSMTSAVTVLATVNVFWHIASCLVQVEIAQPVCLLGFSWGLIAMFSAMMQSVVMQMCVLPMYLELKDRTPKKFRDVTRVSFVVLMFLFSSFAVFGYEAFGQETQSNVLLELPLTQWGVFSRLGAAAAAVGVSPLFIHPMLASVKDRAPSVVSTARIGVVVCTGITAVHVRDLGAVNTVAGALSCATFVALVPCLIGLNLVAKSADPRWRTSMFALLGFGVVVSVLGLFVQDNYATSTASVCLWSQSW